jgi:8-oxo-dGTP pyrophosphatase MutT (NUDIX family)
VITSTATFQATVLTRSRYSMFRRDSDKARTVVHPRALVFIAFIGILFCSPPSSATTDFDAAGVLLIARDEGATYVLLGRDRFRPWYEMLAGSRNFVSDDGKGDAPRRETAYETALRECFEESRGFLKSEYLRTVTDPARFMRDGSFVFFPAEIDKFSVDAIKRNPIPDNVNPIPFLEIGDFAWISVDAILSSGDAVALDDTGRRIQIRHQLKPRLLRAQGAGWL